MIINETGGGGGGAAVEAEDPELHEKVFFLEHK